MGLLKALKTGLLKVKTQEIFSVVLSIRVMYVGEYLNGLTSASVTVAGFHEADLNSDS